jgi:hypothetical protein
MGRATMKESLDNERTAVVNWKVPCLVRALMKSLQPPAVNERISVLDFRISDKLDMKQVHLGRSEPSGKYLVWGG